MFDQSGELRLCRTDLDAACNQFDEDLIFIKALNSELNVCQYSIAALRTVQIEYIHVHHLEHTQWSNDALKMFIRMSQLITN